MAAALIVTAGAPAVPVALAGLAGIGSSWSLFIASMGTRRRIASISDTVE